MKQTKQGLYVNSWRFQYIPCGTVTQFANSSVLIFCQSILIKLICKQISIWSFIAFLTGNMEF